jgi:hypothetical protein
VKIPAALSEPRWRFLLVLLTTLVFLVLANLRSPLPNDDGVLYLMLAEHSVAQGLAAAFELVHWPLYSLAIGGIHAFTGLGMTGSAQLLNGVCAIGLVLAFLRLARELHGEESLWPWALLLLLFHPKLNNYFAYVMRDLGYWAALLGAFALWLEHIERGSWRTLAGWAALTLSAAAFKPEALFFGVLLPLSLLHRMPSRRPGAALLAWAALLLPLLLAGFLAGAGPDALATPVRELPAFPSGLFSELPAAFSSAAARYAEAVLGTQAGELAAWSLAGGLLTILVFTLLNTLGPAQVLLLAVAARREDLLPRPALRPAWTLMLLGGVVLAGVSLAYRQYLDTRIVMVPVLLALASTARALQQLVERARAIGRARHAVVLAGVATAVLLDLGLGLDRPKAHLLACVDWLRDELPASSRLFTNDRQIAAASGARWDWAEVEDAADRIAAGTAPLDASVLWVIRMRPGQSELARALSARSQELSPVTQFTGEGGDRIVVLRPLERVEPALPAPGID